MKIMFKFLLIFLEAKGDSGELCYSAAALIVSLD